MSLNRFFHRYAEISMGPQPEALAGVYAPTFVAAFNRAHGMRSLSVVSVHRLDLSPLHTLATVIWGARFDKTGERMIEFAISYLLEKSDRDWRILSYISRADQIAEMEKEGLL